MTRRPVAIIVALLAAALVTSFAGFVILYLVVGREPGAAKVNKAEELGIPVIDEAAFAQLLETGELPAS